MLLHIMLTILLTDRVPAQVLCCARGAGCSALPESGFCPDDKIPHLCADEQTCDETGECWYECKPLTGGVS